MWICWSRASRSGSEGRRVARCGGGRSGRRIVSKTLEVGDWLLQREQHGRERGVESSKAALEGGARK